MESTSSFQTTAPLQKSPRASAVFFTNMSPQVLQLPLAFGKTISMALALQHLHGHGEIPKSDSFWLLVHPAAHVQSHG